MSIESGVSNSSGGGTGCVLTFINALITRSTVVLSWIERCHHFNVNASVYNFLSLPDYLGGLVIIAQRK